MTVSVALLPPSFDLMVGAYLAVVHTTHRLQEHCVDPPLNQYLSHDKLIQSFL